jgi:hypothetical protein
VLLPLESMELLEEQVLQMLRLEVFLLTQAQESVEQSQEEVEGAVTMEVLVVQQQGAAVQERFVLLVKEMTEQQTQEVVQGQQEAVLV